MGRKLVSTGQPHKRHRIGILFGIPILLFVCGVTLISIGSYNYFKSAYYISSLFLENDYKPTLQSKTITSQGTMIYPKYGEKFADLIIAKANINIPVYHGDSDEQLLKGAGHYDGSRFPGQGSNVVLAGHRNSVFKGLQYVAKGDLIVLNTTYGKYVYKISEIKITKGTDDSIVQPGTSEKLTLYTCYPFNYIGSAPDRYVVISDLIQGTPVKDLQKKGGSK
ncbi:MAG TPA: class D sortase [Clostridium sp.]